MDGTEFIALAERDSKVISVLKSSLEVMQFTHGTRIAMVGVAGVLNYKHEILAIRAALSLLGADPDAPPSYDSKGAGIK